MNWWLPNDERYPAIVRSIRRFVEERTAPAKDVSSEDLRDMKAIFSSLKLDSGEGDQNSAAREERERSNSWQTPEHLQHSGEDGTFERTYGEAEKYWNEGQDGAEFGGPKVRKYP